jgi:hypothetical protein
MSTLKTPDNATLPAPNVSRRRELRRQEARGRPPKPKAKPKAGEPEKPYEATPAEKEAARRVLARRKGRSSAPKVSIRHEGETDVISLRQGDPVSACAVVMDALGICEAGFASWYPSQIMTWRDLAHGSQESRCEPCGVAQYPS